MHVLQQKQVQMCKRCASKGRMLPDCLQQAGCKWRGKMQHAYAMLASKRLYTLTPRAKNSWGACANKCQSAWELHLKMHHLLACTRYISECSYCRIHLLLMTHKPEQVENMVLSCFQVSQSRIINNSSSFPKSSLWQIINMLWGCSYASNKSTDMVLACFLGHAMRLLICITCWQAIIWCSLLVSAYDMPRNATGVRAAVKQ